MKSLNRILPVIACLVATLAASAGRAQETTLKATPKASVSASSARRQNIDEYIQLLRSDVRQQKAEMMGVMMALSAADAAKFWPIYNEYDAELMKLNDQRVGNIKEYVRAYYQMTDDKADELVKNAMAYQNQRSELLAKTYDRVKEAVGAITAARFLQVEQQLLLIIDLQIASELPVVGQASYLKEEEETFQMRNLFIWTATLLLGLTGVFSGGGPSGDLLEVLAAAPQSKNRIYVPAGTRILVRTIDPIDSSKQKTGDRFTGTLETNLVANDEVVAPWGTKVYGRLAQASSAGRMSGSSQLTLELTDIVIGGTAYPLLTSTFEMKGQGEGKKTAGKVVGGAGLGALIGGIAGGGKGALIGMAAGGVGGTVLAGSKKGQQLSIPSESLIEFRLQQPASLPVAR